MRRFVGTLTLAGVLAGAIGGTAAAGRPPWAATGKGKAKAGKPSKPAPTKMRFKLVDHEVDPGDTVEGDVRLLSGTGKSRAPVDGATLVVLVDKVEVDSLTTDAGGRAQVAYVAETEGEHVMKVVFAGDADRRRAKRAQGFEVGTVVDDGSTEA